MRLGNLFQVEIGAMFAYAKRVVSWHAPCGFARMSLQKSLYETKRRVI